MGLSLLALESSLESLEREGGLPVESYKSLSMRVENTCSPWDIIFRSEEQQPCEPPDSVAMSSLDG